MEEAAALGRALNEQMLSPWHLGGPHQGGWLVCVFWGVGGVIGGLLWVYESE